MAHLRNTTPKRSILYWQWGSAVCAVRTGCIARMPMHLKLFGNSCDVSDTLDPPLNVENFAVLKLGGCHCKGQTHQHIASVCPTNTEAVPDSAPTKPCHIGRDIISLPTVRSAPWSQGWRAFEAGPVGRLSIRPSGIGSFAQR